MISSSILSLKCLKVGISSSILSLKCLKVGIRCMGSMYRQGSNFNIDWNTIINDNDNSIDKNIQIETLKDMYVFSLKSLRYGSKSKQKSLSYGQSTLCAEDDAALLVLASLSLPLLGSPIRKNNFIMDDGIKKYGNRILSSNEKVTILKRLKLRVLSNIPMAYLVYAAYQQGEYFYVNNNVIIPRSFIGEILANQHLKSLVDIKNINYVCDLCTGSGALAILTTKYLPKVKNVIRSV